MILDDGTCFFSSDLGTGPVGLVIHPWEISLAHTVAGRFVTESPPQGTISSMVPLGNRLRVTVGALTAEITAASAETLSIAVGDIVVASFKATELA